MNNSQLTPKQIKALNSLRTTGYCAYAGDGYYLQGNSVKTFNDPVWRDFDKIEDAIQSATSRMRGCDKKNASLKNA